MTLMKMLFRSSRTAALILGLATVAGVGAQPAHSQSGSGAEIGNLSCIMTGSRNLIIRSTLTFECEFKPVRGEVEKYEGRMTRTGVDLTARREFAITWAVLAPTEVARQPGSLRGTYVGGSSEVALGAGIGANVLVGGGDNSFTLQPISLVGVAGAGASLTVSRFVLE